ncbi:MAG: hypothetical protein MUF22_03545 [Chitinispirillaceae bacterium]|nr:hypothetical protein [Chitinispirillaceae bacterium]
MKKKISGKKPLAKKSAPKKSAVKKAIVRKAAVKKVLVRKPGQKKSVVKSAAGAKKFTAKQLEYFKSRLLDEKNRVLNDIGALQQTNLKTTLSDASGENSRYSYHMGDVASLSYGREFSMGLSERQQKYLEQIDEALDRIQNGTYGICMVTGELITPERLEEVPVAKYSVRGKEMLERRRRQGS